jgi:hypothetical protein
MLALIESVRSCPLKPFEVRVTFPIDVISQYPFFQSAVGSRKGSPGEALPVPPGQGMFEELNIRPQRQGLSHAQQRLRDAELDAHSPKWGDCAS